MQFNRKFATRAAALAILGGTGAAVLGAAGPAFADTPPASGTATVTVNQILTFGFNGGASFTLAPGVTSPHAISFYVQSNSYKGYSVSIQAPDLTGSGATTIPADDLSYQTNLNGSQIAGGALQLGHTAGVFSSVAHAPGSPSGDQYTQDWTASIPSNTPPDAYSTQITYVATVNP